MDHLSSSVHNDRPTADSSPDSSKRNGATARGRPRAALACVTCRLRKVKCDFQTAEGNICAACQSSNTRCVLSRKDGRRYREPREDIMAIKSRLAYLESLMEHNTDTKAPVLVSGVSRTPMAEQGTICSETNGHWLGTLSAQNDEQRTFSPELHASAPLAGSIQAGTGTQPDPMFCTGTLNNEFEMSNPDDGGALSLTNTLTLPLMPHDNTSFKNAPDVLVRPRFYAESDQAQLGFYGPTSQCYLQYQCSGPEVDDLDSDSSPPLLRIDADSPSARKAILESYWRSNELWSSIVDRGFFTAHKAAGHASQYYSQGLEDAMLACGSRNSTSSAIRKVGREYLHRAKVSLQTEIESPTIASLQGCLLVSNFEAGMGRNRIGWMFMGVAVRLLLDLGLHEDRSTLVERGAISVEEWRYHKRLFLGAFLYDTIWGWFIGRPRSIPLSNVTVVLSTNTIDEGDQSHLYEWTRLCSKMAQAQDIVNGPLPLDSDTMDRLSRIYVELESEYNNLPPDLAWNEESTVTLEPSAYSLHTQYLAIQIMLLRPPGRNTQTTQYLDIVEAGDNVFPGQTLERALELIHKKAVRIARLVQLLTQIHGIELVVPTILDNIFIAALSLIRNAIRNPQSLEEDEQWLRLIAKTLGSVQRHYHMACRIRNALTDIVQSTAMAEIFRASPGPTSPERMGLPPQEKSRSEGTYFWPASGRDLLMNDFEKVLGLPPTGMNTGDGWNIEPNLGWLFGKG